MYIQGEKIMDKKAYEIVNKNLLTNLYIHKKMGLPKIQKYMQDQYNITVSTGFLVNRCKEHNIKLRTSSEGRRAWDDNCLDYNKSFLDFKTKEWIDGFLIGDGSASFTHSTKVARLSCGVQYKEFCEYMRSGFLNYNATGIKYYASSQNGKGSKGTYDFRTRNHPDLYKHSIRWYGDATKKRLVPEDAIITPISTMLWYLGDGTVITKNNTTVVRLSTDSFYKEGIEEILIPKLKEHDIDCTRTSENRIRVISKGIPAFFNFIGRSSPIRCYDYKFNLPEWRFESKRLSHVASDLNVGYNRLLHLVQKGKIPCYRASEKGRPRLFPEHIKIAQELINSGDLY